MSTIGEITLAVQPLLARTEIEEVMIEYLGADEDTNPVGSLEEMGLSLSDEDMVLATVGKGYWHKVLALYLFWHFSDLVDEGYFSD